MSMYPKPVRAIHQIEITSRCNLRCKYCVHPHMGRKKEDMTFSTFQQAIFLAQVCYQRGDQRELNLCGIGESTMHPEFAVFVEFARLSLPNIFIALATNGILLTEDVAAVLKKNRVATWVSLHRPEKAGRAIEIAKDYGILHGVSADPSVAAIDWAGKVDWFVSARNTTPCPWLSEGRVMVCADGAITTCCLDGEGAGIIGFVGDNLDELRVQPYSLCEGCHHSVPRDEARVPFDARGISCEDVA